MKLTIIHPCIGRRLGQKYIRTWQMESLPAATLAGLTPNDVEVRFYDDRMEAVPFDEATDLVALSVETYTAKRAYQIASEYRKRHVPIVMGGFHATLCPEEVARYAETVVCGEAESLWPRVIDDARHGRLEKFYRQTSRPSLAGLKPDRSIFHGKRYLPIGLIEAGRGCHFKCDFCAVQTVFKSTQTRRPVDDIIEELRRLKSERKLFFFVDDNITSNLEQAKEFFRALITVEHPVGQFPGTPLYRRLQDEGRLLYENWWLDERYSYNRIPFQPHGMTPELLQKNCLAARREFYSWPSIAQRSLAGVNRSNWFMWRNFYLINALHRSDVSLRDHYPLGDESWRGQLLTAN